MRIENEHSTFSSFARNNSVFLFDEPSSVVEPNLHTLLLNLIDQEQILRYCWNTQEVINVGLIARFSEWDITDMLNGVNCVIPCLHIVG